MAQLAIKGHPTRGKEVIEILEMLGYVNIHDYIADTDCLFFYGGESIKTIYYDWVYNCEDMLVFTLEEFLEKFPYKVGDKVQHKGATSCGTVYVIEHMNWANDHIEYEISPLFDYNHTGLVTILARDLQPYKEENMEENLTIQDIRDNNAEWLLNKLQEMSSKSALQTISDLYDELHKPQYPKTYEECCKVLSLGEDGRLYTKGYKASLIQEFQQLLICRDAYWKIAGEEMGLGKPWKPDWNGHEFKYGLKFMGHRIEKTSEMTISHVICFPTEEMRDAFYENFKDFIEKCKKFL